ncbi:hypothetical protein [Cohnella zeiphila]|uniref:Uncharacterized protein n=1 Tax=Cohnella zeiphila TaxID=2761120 RepID=A0A7X0VVH6_9BACL|nr:hypothetical protein [Cohnella zeiphila]MBB6731991.1 hypothetical protein [Cohnella zeiphila]
MLALQVRAEADKTRAMTGQGLADGSRIGIQAANRLDAIVRTEGLLLKKLARAVAGQEMVRWRESGADERPEGKPRNREAAAIREVFVPALIRLDGALYRYLEELLRLEERAAAAGTVRLEAGPILQSFAHLAELNEWKWELVLDVMEEWDGAADPAEVRKWQSDHRKLADRIDGLLEARLEAEESSASSDLPHRGSESPCDE